MSGAGQNKKGLCGTPLPHGSAVAKGGAGRQSPGRVGPRGAIG